MADKIVQVITPVFDDKAVKDFSKKMEKVSVGTKFTNGLKTAGKIGAVGLGGLTALGLLFRGVSEEANKLGDSMDKVLAKTDELSTLASDIGISSGKLALFQASTGALGISQEDFSKMIASIQKEQATGSLKQNYSGLDPVEVVSRLQKRWQQTTDMAEKRDIEGALGLRGKRASELLQGNIDTLMKEFSNIPVYDTKGQVVSNTNEASLTKNIENLARLEGYQAKLKQETDLIDLQNKQSLINEKSIESQATYQRAFNKNVDVLLKNSGSLYDIASTREQAMQTMFITISKLSQPIFKTIQGLTNDIEKGKSLGAIIGNFLTNIIVKPLIDGLSFFGGKSKTERKEIQTSKSIVDGTNLLRSR
jgi:hypothetical protein